MVQKYLEHSRFSSPCKLEFYPTWIIPCQGTITRNDLNELISEISSSSKSLYYLAEETVYFLKYVLTGPSCRNSQVSYLVNQLYKASWSVKKWLQHSLRLVKGIPAKLLTVVVLDQTVSWEYKQANILRNQGKPFANVVTVCSPAERLIGIASKSHNLLLILETDGLDFFPSSEINQDFRSLWDLFQI